MNRPLRIAVVVDASLTLPLWEVAMIQQWRREDHLQLAAYIVANSMPVDKYSLGLRLFRQFEDFWFRPDNYAGRKEALPEGLKVTIDEAERISSLEADIVYCSSVIQDTAKLANLSRYGVWKIDFGINEYEDSAPIAFWEVMREEAEIGARLTAIMPGCAERITLYEGSLNTVPFSVKNTYNDIAWRASSFVSYRAKELYTAGAESFFAHYRPALSQSAQRPFPSPGSFSLLYYWVRNSFRYLGYKLRRWRKEKRFSLLYSIHSFDGQWPFATTFNALPMPKGVFWADPFIVSANERHIIFFEEYVYAAGKAHISAITIDHTGKADEPKIILESPSHLSYPFILEQDGDYYMVPDTSGSATVQLFKATSFPFQWERVMNLMEDCVVIDPTVFYANGKWWMFGNTASTPTNATNDQLCLYYSDRLMSTEWKPHPQNPVATKIGNSRPAGRIFSMNGKLYRPAQHNASRQYGYAIKINEIVTLTEQSYEEREVESILPEQFGLLAMHTMNFSETMLVIDGILK